MPVQDNDDKRTADQPAVDAEEEFRRKQAQAQEQQQEESGAQKSGKLLPILNAKAEHHQSRIDSLDEKIANQTDKIDRNKAKIEALSAKADKLEDTNRMLKATIGNLPGIGAIIANNEKRIQAIREVKIPKRQEKIDQGWKKIDTLTAKRDRIEHKLNRVIALNDTIKSFSIGFNKERREAFADAMTRLNRATVDCLSDKKNALVAQKDQLMQTYNDPATSMADRFRIQQKINDVTKRVTDLESKIMKLVRPETHYAEQTNDQLDASMKLTGDKLAEMADSGNVTMPALAEETVTAAQKVETLDRSKVAELADQLGIQPLSNAEMQVEDDYNMIDGIINNGSKEDIDKAKVKLREGIRNMESIVDNDFIPQEMRENAAAKLAKMKQQLSLLDSSDEVFVESSLATMLDNGTAELTDNGGFKVNADYYFDLPRDERHFETLTEVQAMEVISALTASAVDFSAMSKGNDKVSLVVAEKDVPVLNDIMFSAIGKVARTAAAKENAGKGEKGKYQTINPEYYASLPKDERFTSAEPAKLAQAITAELEKAGVPFSAVVRKNNTIAITVRKENAPAYKRIESAVKATLAKERVPVSPAKVQAKQQPKRSAPQRQGTAFLSRSDMQKEAQRVRQQGKKQDKPAPAKKKDNQGLE